MNMIWTNRERGECCVVIMGTPLFDTKLPPPKLSRFIPPPPNFQFFSPHSWPTQLYKIFTLPHRKMFFALMTELSKFLPHLHHTQLWKIFSSSNHPKYFPPGLKIVFNPTPHLNFLHTIPPHLTLKNSTHLFSKFFMHSICDKKS